MTESHEETRTICEKCGEDIIRRPTHFECPCAIGFVVQWSKIIEARVSIGVIIDSFEEVNK